MVDFSAENVERLFGAEDAENENVQRFKEYFVYNRAYENIANKLAIRLVVGHKGVGKSALLKRAYLDNLESRNLAVWVRPNDIELLRSGAADKSLNELIEQWKTGLLRVVTQKAASHLFGEAGDTLAGGIGRGIIDSVLKLIGDKLSAGEKAVSHAVVSRFSQDKEIYIYIDDVDRGWSASEADIRNISALLNAVRDICGQDDRIKVRIALRSDVYFLVRTADESTDKVERHVVWLDWTNHEILCIAAKRIQTFFGIKDDDNIIARMTQRAIDTEILSKIIDPDFNVGRGHWAGRPIHNILLSLCRKRPRDLVKLFTGAAKIAFDEKSYRISSSQLERSFESYSNERLQDIVNEFKSELPQIKDLLLAMRPTRKEVKTAMNFQFSSDILISKLNSIMQQIPMRFTYSSPVTAKSLIQFLYKIDFITARIQRDGQIERKYFDQSRFLASEYADFGNAWEIHPAYRWALQPRSVDNVLDSLD